MGIDTNKLKRMNTLGYDIFKLIPDLELRKDEIDQSKGSIMLDW